MVVARLHPSVLLACLALVVGSAAGADLTLSRTHLRERLPVGSVVGVLADADSPDAVFTLVAGSGDGDNAKFAIDGRLVRSTAVLQASTPAASIRVRSVGSGGTEERSLALTIDALALGRVMGWGSDYSHGDTPGWTPPDSLGMVDTICAGYNRAYAIRADGAIVSWSYTADDVAVERQPQADGQRWIALAADLTYVVALRLDGTVEVLSGAAPPAGLAGVVAIAAGQRFALALKNDGTVVAWGDAQALPAVLAVPALGQVVAIAAGIDFGLALRSDGTIQGWGQDNIAQASGGNGLTGVTAISAGDEFGYALLQDGTVQGWGNSSFGRTATPAGLVGVVAIDTGEGTTFALKNDGTVVAWGITLFEVHQTELPPELHQVIAISSGRQPSLALHTLGRRPSAPVVAFAPAQEGQAAGLSVATLAASDADGDAITFSLTRTDGAPLTVGGPAGGSILTTAALDCETRKAHLLRVRATDATGLYRETDATLTVLPLSEWAPSSLSLIPALIPATAVAGDAIGRLRAADPDAAETFTYALTADDGGRFTVVGDQVVLAAGGQVPGDVRSLTARVTDSGGLTLTKIFQLPVGYAGPASAPAHVGTLALTRATVSERFPVGTIVGWLSDPLAASTRFILVDGAGDDHNGLFTISGSLLRTAAVLRAAEAPVLRIRVRSDDGGAPREDVFAITVEPRRYGNAAAWGANGSGDFAGLGLVRLAAMGYGDGIAITRHQAGSDDVVAVDKNLRTSVRLYENGTVTGSPAPPPGLDRVIAVACHMYHILALRDDGSVVAWGDQLCDRACLMPPAGLADAVAVGAGSQVSWAVLSDGTVIGWGRDNINQVSGAAGVTAARALGGCEENATALRSDGTVVCWGNPSYNRTTPPAGLANVIAIDGGDADTLALRGDGKVFAWGPNSEHQDDVPASLSNAFAVSAGRFASVALHRAAFTRTLTITVSDGAGPCPDVRVAGGDEFAEAHTGTNGTVVFSGVAPQAEQSYGFNDPADDAPPAPLAPQ